jgi:two-component system, OmpR family, sensor histidine kinase MtrB
MGFRLPPLLTPVVGVVGSLGLTTGVVLLLHPAVRSPAAAGWLYLLIVLPVTLRWGRAVGVGTALLAGVLLLGLLAEPRFSLDVQDRQDGARALLAIGGMTLAALLVDAANRGRIAAELRLAIQRDGVQLQRLALAGVAHDLGQPLTALMMAAQMLERDTGTMEPTRRAELSAEVVGAAQRIHRMMTDWLAVAHGETPELRLQPMDLAPLVRDVTTAYTDRFTSVALQCPASIAAVAADPLACERVLGNLLSNAAKYGDGTVSVVVQEYGDTLWVSVLDQGPGLPSGPTEQLFQPFTRGEGAAARAQGYGLGLAVAAMLVHAHGGRLWAENQPGGGAAFHVELPLAAPPEMDTGLATTSTEAGTVAPHTVIPTQPAADAASRAPTPR